MSQYGDILALPLQLLAQTSLHTCTRNDFMRTDDLHLIMLLIELLKGTSSKEVMFVLSSVRPTLESQMTEKHCKMAQPALSQHLKYVEAAQHKTMHFAHAGTYLESIDRNLIKYGSGLPMQHDASTFYRKPDCISMLYIS